jgi:hypothetical protein
MRGGRTLRRGALLLLAVVVLVPGCGRGGAERREREARGALLADSVALAYGGVGAWQALRFLRFDLSVRDSNEVRARFRHLWNLGTGESRYEADLAALRDLPGSTGSRRRTGTAAPPHGRLIAVVNRATGKGLVRVEPAPPEISEEALLALARERVEEDGFWLFLPFLLDAPGVAVEDRGEITAPRTRRPARELFVTRKGDRRTVRLFVEPATHRILETEVPAEGNSIARSFVWRSDVNVGGIRLVAERQEDGARSMIYDLMAAPERVALEVFTDLTRRMPY